VNIALFLSNDLRRDVTIFIGIQDKTEWKMISFAGDTLRRVSPDERSISFFLLKAFEKLESLPFSAAHKMDNGIMIQRLEIEKFLKEWEENISIASHDSTNQVKYEKAKNSLYIYNIDAEINLDDHPFKLVTRPRTPERFILDINATYDLQNNT